MALAIVNGATSNQGTGTPVTITYTNSSACVMILDIETRGGSGGFCPITSITDSAGITWTRRRQAQFNSTNFSGVSGNTNHVTKEIWWANITANHASAVTVTINIGSIANQATSTTINQFQVTGSLVPATPWDVNGSATGVQTYSNASASQNPSVAWTVSSSAALVLGFLGEMGASGSTAISTAGTGYTAVTGTGVTIGTSGTGIARISVEDQLNASGSGTATYTASSNIREYIFIVDALTSDSTGTANAAGTVSGTISTALTKASIAGVGKETFTGTASTALTKASMVVTTKETFPGTITTTLTKASQSGSAKEIFTGTISTALTKASISALSALQTFTGIIATHLTGVSQVVEGTETLTGTITTGLSGISQALAGTGDGVSDVTGDITTDLAGSRIHMQATTFETFTGTITTNLSGLAQIVIAKEIVSGHVVTALGPANFALVAEERVVGTVVTRLGEAGQLVATFVQAEVIILGPIEMALPPFRSLVLGAQLGAPGSGKWYSWRYTDS